METLHEAWGERRGGAGVRAMSRQSRLFEPVVSIPEDLGPAVDLWLQHKAERRERYKPTGLRLLIERMTEMGPERAMAAVRHSIANNWSGLFEPAGQDKAPTPATPRRPWADNTWASVLGADDEKEEPHG